MIIECIHFLVYSHHMAMPFLNSTEKNRCEISPSWQKKFHRVFNIIHNHHLVQQLLPNEPLWICIFTEFSIQLANVKINLTFLGGFHFNMNFSILNQLLEFGSSFNYEIQHNNWNWNIATSFSLVISRNSSILCLFKMKLWQNIFKTKIVTTSISKTFIYFLVHIWQFQI